MRYGATENPNRPRRRRGVTLVEMLVTVGLLLLVMTIIVGIFQSATSAVTIARTAQHLDESLRRVEITLTQDLAGVTTHMFPPVDPDEQRGYFEYIENSFADLQGEDTDDCLAFTAKAPPGQPFTGRVWVPTQSINGSGGGFPINPTFTPITLTSQFAEIIYFLRNGNLYRRVLLVVPQRRGMIAPGNIPNNQYMEYQTGIFGSMSPAGQVFYTTSWQGMNDISARPAPHGSNVVPVPNSLGELTNRQWRFARPRFTDDYLDNLSGSALPDGIPDDLNGNGAADYYPTLYPYILNTNLINDPSNIQLRAPTHDRLPFPFMYPGAFSVPDTNRLGYGVGYGWMHSPDPHGLMLNPAGLPTMFNHGPLDVGDSLPMPPAGDWQTWWGFPTWRETISPFWTDPVQSLNSPLFSPGNQSLGLSWQTLLSNPAGFGFLPPMSPLYRDIPQLFNDGAGSPLFVTPQAPLLDASGNIYWNHIWEDDLLLTGVRSFDVKAYDPNVKAYSAIFPNDPSVQLWTPGYYDLGYASNPALYTYPSNATTNIAGTSPPAMMTLGHEGRMPPLQSDFRPDAQWPGLLANVGDNDTSGATIRMVRTYDTWSTDYSNVPATPINNVLNGPPFAQPIYPSYSAPYPVPLRGIHVQIRVVDPRNERVKTMTIHQDFSNFER